MHAVVDRTVNAPAAVAIAVHRSVTSSIFSVAAVGSQSTAHHSQLAPQLHQLRTIQVKDLLYRSVSHIPKHEPVPQAMLPSWLSQT
jgi:hypothetical protein